MFLSREFISLLERYVAVCGGIFVFVSVIRSAGRISVVGNDASSKL